MALAEEGEAGFCHGQPGQGALQSGQGIFFNMHRNIQREGGSESSLPSSGNCSLLSTFLQCFVLHVNLSIMTM